MKVCFDACVSEAGKLDDALARTFARHGAAAAAAAGPDQVVRADFSACGVCAGRMALVRRPQPPPPPPPPAAHGGFGDNQPRPPPPDKVLARCGPCKLSYSLPIVGREGAAYEPSDVVCKLCGFQVRVFRGEQIAALPCPALPHRPVPSVAVAGRRVPPCPTNHPQPHL